MRGIIFSLGLSVLICSASASAQPFTLSSSQADVVLVPTFDHADVPVAVTAGGGGFDYGALQLTSDSSWVAATVDSANGRILLKFTTAALTNSSYTATVTVTHGADSANLFVNASLAPLNLFKLIDDPVRSRMYGIQLNGINAGAIAVIDPLTAGRVSSVTVGRRPTGMAVSNDGTELFVINCVDKTISVINLNTLAVTQTLTVPNFINWGEPDTSANIATGPGNILYYTDGSWAPVLHVYNRSTGLVSQSLVVETSSYGFGDIALNADKTQLYAWGQYGWSAGLGGSYAARFTVSGSGALTFAQKSLNSLSRDPLETPVLVSSDGSQVFVKQTMVSATAVGTINRTFSGDVYSITPGGEVAATSTGVFQTSTGNKVYTLPVTATVQAITSDYARLVYFNSTSRDIATIDLMAAVGPEILGQNLSPADGSIVLPPSALQWSALPGATGYKVYLGTSLSAVTNATTASPQYLGASATPSFALTSTLAVSTTYYWRVDTTVGSSVNKGAVYSFTVSPISSSLKKVDAVTVQGHADLKVSVSLAAAAASLTWTASANQSWITFTNPTGTTPANLEIVLNASNLPLGVHQGVVTLTGSSGTLFTLPLNFTVEPLSLTILKSDPVSSKVYGISENTAVTGAKAYLLELDSATEQILRVLQVGSSVTDLAIHNAENRIYIPNWVPGSLLALNKTTLALERTYGFTAFQGMGYGQNDVYRVAAGANGRIVVEEQDQWVDLAIFNTSTGAKHGTIGLRQGGGMFDPTGRYYYHGEDNSSGAKIYKLDVIGDVFTTLSSIRVSSYSYYGSRTVVVSESGTGVFWNGSHFNSALAEQWTMSAETYSTSANGRLAFGETKIFDTTTKQQVLGMPATTRVSAHNSTTQKLVVQTSTGIRFYAAQFPLTLVAPVLTATGAATTTTIPLAWTDNSLETSFTLQWRLAGNTSWTNTATAPAQNQTSFTLTGLILDTAYEFRIKADAPSLSSDWSPVFAARTLAPPPPTVVLNSATLSGTSVLLSFSATGSPTNIQIQRALAADGPWGDLVAVAGSSTSYLDTTAVALTTYYYRIRGVLGTVQSAYSSVASVTTPVAPPPVSPTGLGFISVSSTQISLTWSDSANETGYLVERRLSGQATWTLLATLNANVTIYDDTTVAAGASYVYRITAFNATAQATPILTPEMTAATLPVVMSDDFDPDRDATQWASSSVLSSVDGGQGFNGSKALWFGHDGSRNAITKVLDVLNGGIISFKMRAGSTGTGGSYWDLSESGEGIAVEYSTNGTSWTSVHQINTVYPALSTWQSFVIPIPASANSSTTYFRWRQLSHSGAAFDCWALDDVQINAVPAGPPTPPSFNQHPEPSLVMDGASTSFSVTGSKPGLSFQWSKDDQPIPGATSSTYYIPSAHASHAGNYSCRITEGTAFTDSNKAVLGVFQAVGAGTPIQQNEGGRLSLNMQIFPANLRTLLSFQWDREAEGDLEGIGEVTGATTDRLTVHNSLPAAQAAYVCHVSYLGVYTVDVRPYNVVIRALPSITPIDDVSYVVGHPISIPVDVSDPFSTVTVTGLPAGVKFDAASSTIIGLTTITKSYTVTVTAKNVAGSAAPVTFQLVLSGFPATLVGTYAGITGHEFAGTASYRGQLRFQVAKTSATTGTLTFGSTVHRFTGNVAVNEDTGSGILTFTILKNKVPWLRCEVNVIIDASLHLGTLTDVTDDAGVNVAVVRNDWTSSFHTPQTGLWNLSATPTDDARLDPIYPHGVGFMNLTIAPAGTVKWTGRLSDGTTLVGSSLIGNSGHIPLHQSLYTNTGSVTALVVCDSDGVSGEANWTKAKQPIKSTTRFYKSGFPLHTLTLDGGRYVRPAVGSPLMTDLANTQSNAEIIFSMDEEDDLTQLLTISAKHAVSFPAAVPNLKAVKLTLTPATGLFNGTFTLNDPDPLKPGQQIKRTVEYRGCLIPGDNIGVGYFLLPDLPTSGTSGTTSSTSSIWSSSLILSPTPAP